MLSVMQVYRDKRKSCEEVVEEVWRFTVLAKWESTHSPPQSEEVRLPSSFF